MADQQQGQPGTPTTPSTPKAPIANPVRTFQGDISSKIQRQDLSVAKIVLAEQERARAKAVEFGVSSTHQRPRLGVFIGIAVAVALVVATGIGAYLFFSENSNESTTTALQVPAPIVFADKNQEIFISDSLDRKAFITEIGKYTKSAPTQSGNITYFYFTSGTGTAERILGTQEVLQTMAPNMPGRLLRSLKNVFMAGMYAHSQNKAFLIMKTESYEAGFAGMLAWEDHLADDLSPLFGTVSGVLPWHDATVRNTDIRTLFDTSTSTVFVYTFLDRETIVITPDETTLLELVNRFHTPRSVTR